MLVITRQITGQQEIQGWKLKQGTGKMAGTIQVESRRNNTKRWGERWKEKKGYGNKGKERKKQGKMDGLQNDVRSIKVK